MEHLYELEFFDNSQEYKENLKIAKELIKEQGVDVCRDEFRNDYIDTALKTCTFGFFIVSRRAYPLRNKGRASKNYILNGYILGYHDSMAPEEISVELVCSRKNYRYGDVLMNAVEFHARSITGVKRLRLISLPEEKVVSFYLKHGFVIRGLPLYLHKDIKGYKMLKTL